MFEKNHLITDKFRLLPFLIIIFIGYYYNCNNPYFWDTIQFGSQHADWYYTNNFHYFFLPERIDSGHPPFFGMYIATCWLIFGKSLMVSHLAMFPFAIGTLFLLFKIGDYFLDKDKSILFVLIAFVDPTLTAQHLLVSPDVVLVFFMLLSMYGIFYKKSMYVVLGSMGLAAISMRGMVLVFVFFVFELVYALYLDRNKLLYVKIFINKIKFYIPAGVVGVGFLISHHLVVGWTGQHENSPWAGCFEKVDMSGYFRNIAIAGFRFLEFGRIGVVVLIIFIFITGFKNNSKLIQLWILLMISIIFIITPQLSYKILLSPRYLLPISILLSLLACVLIFNSDLLNRQQRIIALVIMYLCLFSGNFWTYPKGIAMACDATLAHLNYFEPRKKMLAYIDSHHIQHSSIGSTFPENDSLKYIDLKNTNASFHYRDFNKSTYIYYTNMMNDFSDKELDFLQNSWVKVKSFTNRNIEVTLYKNPIIPKK